MRILYLTALAVLSGCSSQPQTASTIQPAAVLAAAAPTQPAAAAVSEEEEFKPPTGYRRKEEGGRIYYCTKMTVLGSRFPKDDCRTQAELEDLELQKASMRGEMEQRRAVCASAAGCANP